MFDQEEANKKRVEVQQEVLELSKIHKNMLLTAATGTGKGRCVMQIINEDTFPQKWLIVVPELLQIQNLKDDIKKHNFEHLYNKIEDIICYASFEKYKGRELSLWFNEAHKLSALKSDIASTIKYNRIIADTATLPKIVKQRLLTLGEFYEYSLPLKRAIELSILPEPVINIIKVQVDDKIKRNIIPTKKGDWKLTDREFLFNMEKQITMWTEKIEDLQKEGKFTGWIDNKINQIGAKRKKFLSSIKTPALQKLCKELQSKRFICYTGSIDQCNLLGDMGGTNVMHSKKGGKHNKDTLQKFNDYELSSLFVIKMGREGLNLNGIECVAICQLSSGRDEGLEFIQSAGRSMRSEAPEIYVLVAEHTMDERNLKRALKEIPEKYIHYKEL